jgi:hypothetical protein
MFGVFQRLQSYKVTTSPPRQLKICTFTEPETEFPDAISPLVGPDRIIGAHCECTE